VRWGARLPRGPAPASIRARKRQERRAPELSLGKPELVLLSIRAARTKRKPAAQSVRLALVRQGPLPDLINIQMPKIK